MPGLLALVWAAVWTSAAFGTDGLEPIGSSTQALLRGGADVAVGDTALSQINNPASLALHTRLRFDFSDQVLCCKLRWSTPIGSSHSHAICPLANAAVAVPISERLTFGLALQSKSGMGTHYHIRHLLIPFYERHIASDIKNASLSLNFGYELSETLSVGAGVRAEAVTAKFNSVLGPAGVDFGRGVSYGAGFDLGVHYRATKTLAFGVAYRSPTWMGDLSGGRMKASLIGVLPLGLGDGAIDEFRLPQRISAGAAWDATERLKLVAELR